MTVCVALKLGNKVVIGTDSAVTTESTRIKNIVNLSKIVKIKNYYVLCSGAGTITESLQEILNDEDYIKKLKINTCLEAKYFAESVYSLMKTDLEDSAIRNKDEYLDFFGEILIATPNHIFCVYTDLSVYEFDKYTATGAGSDYALGVLSDLYKNIGSREITWELLEAIVERSVLAACEFSLVCAPPVIVKRVDNNK